MRITVREFQARTACETYTDFVHPSLVQALQEASASNVAHKQLGEPFLSGDSTPASQTRKDIASPYEAVSPDSQGVSKIPTPVQPFGSLRRETSVSSLGSVLTKSNDGRHHSQSSIVTAFRDQHSGKLRPDSSSRSSSYNTFPGVDSSPRARESAAGLRGGEHANQVTSRGGSPAKKLSRTSKTASSTRASLLMAGPNTHENDVPEAAP